VANLVNHDDTVTIAMSALEKAGALHRDLTFPRSAVTGRRGGRQCAGRGARTQDARRFDPLGDHGGFLAQPGRPYARGPNPGMVIHLTGEHDDRVVMTVGDTQEAVTSLS
jgi:hypothetical protein